MTRGSHAHAYDPDSEPGHPRTDPIADANHHSLARLIEDRAQAVVTPKPAGRPAPDPAMEEALAEQMHRHQLARNELFHTYDCEQLVQRTLTLREQSVQRRRRARHATRVAIMLLWFSCFTTAVAGAASCAWFVIHTGCSPSTSLLSSVGLASGGVVSIGAGLVAMRRKARQRRN